MLHIHIAGAIINFLSGGAVVFKKLNIKLFRLSVALQFLTGTVLAISTGSSFLGYCSKLGLYLAFWLMVEGIVIIRNEQQARLQALLQKKAH